MVVFEKNCWVAPAGRNRKRSRGTTEDHYVNINSYSYASRKVNATDTSTSNTGQETRDLKSVDVSAFDRLILIKVKTMEIN